MSASPSFPDLPAGWVEEIRGYERVWKSPATNLPTLLIVHGFGENSDRYRHVPHFLQNHFSNVVAIDLPGHGRSPEKRGDCQRFSDFTDRVKSVLGSASHILGHSFGGLVVLKLLKMGALNYQKSIVVSAPLLQLTKPAPFVKALAGRMIEPILPHLQLENEIDPAVVSHDESVVRAYKADPLNHSKITPRMFKEMTKAMDEMKVWQGPALKEGQKFAMIAPLADPLVHPPTNLNFYEKLKVGPAAMKQLFPFEGFFHESMNESGKAAVFAALDRFYGTK